MFNLFLYNVQINETIYPLPLLLYIQIDRETFKGRILTAHTNTNGKLACNYYNNLILEGVRARLV